VTVKFSVVPSQEKLVNDELFLPSSQVRACMAGMTGTLKFFEAFIIESEKVLSR
jgi:hypothetical protein